MPDGRTKTHLLPSAVYLLSGSTKAFRSVLFIKYYQGDQADGLGIWHVWGEEKHSLAGEGNLKERDNLEDLGGGWDQC